MSSGHRLLRRASPAVAGPLALGAALLCMALGVAAHEPAAHVARPAAAAPQQTAWGVAGQARAVTRTITVTMTDDMRFAPARIEVQQGHTVRFVIRNRGALLHEFVLGTREELDKHAALMLKFPGMEHDEPYMAHVGPDKTGQIVWHFNRAGDFDFACLIAGHYQAGMKGQVKVLPRGGGRVAASRPGA